MSICRRIKRGEKANWSPFCDCVANIGRSSVLKCSCGEEEEGWVEWAWDPGDQGLTVPNPHGTARFIGRGFGRPPSLGSPILLMADNRQVMFHPSYSSGTAAVRGQHSLEPGMHHYWEVKILTPLYGTDMMVGIGTGAADLQKDRFKYCSLLGEDNESWGFSYNGNIQHGGDRTPYGYPFGLGSIVGVHVDLWHGKLEFYLNRKPLGVAFSNLHGKTLFPMASSTAAKSGVRLIHASSHPHSLLFSCTHALGIASEASSCESQPAKRLCLENCGTDIVWSSSPVGNKTTHSVSCVQSTLKEGMSLVEVGPTKNTSKNLEGHSCGILPLSSANSTRGANFCTSTTRTDGSGKGQLNSRSCDVMQHAHMVGGGSNFENHSLTCDKSEASEPTVEANKTVIPVSKLHQSAHWVSKTLSTGRCKDKDSRLQFGVDCAPSVKTSETRFSRSENHLSSEPASNSSVSDPYFLTLIQDEDEEMPSQLDTVCPRKRKQPSLDFVERIWAIPGLRAKVESSFWWLLGTRRGKGVVDSSADTGTSHKPLIMVDEDDEWGRGAHGEIIKSGQGESVHHQTSEGSVSRVCHERLCLMCHPVI